MGKINDFNPEMGNSVANIRIQLRYIKQIIQDIIEGKVSVDVVEEILSKIPTQASSTNQLADKQFVNSSISTNTADFKGTYDSLAELQAVAADNNDYGFVVDTDELGNTVYKRYKFDGTSWTFEFNLNNSSFTSAQWDAINSGATAENITRLTTNSVLSTSIRNIVVLTEEDYDELETKDVNTFYAIV